MRLNDTGISPSFEEMKEALGLKSKSGIHRLISALEERGFLRRLPNRARALEIIKIPNAHEGYTAPNSNIEEVADRQTPYMPASPQMNASQYQDTDNINNLSDMNIAALQGKPRLSKRILNPSVHNSYSTNIIAANDDIMAIPLHGRIAAGVPIEALEGDQLLSVPAALLGPGEHFALEVAGDSMHEAGILDGDFALIRKAERAKNGDIVVALVNNEEATLKYFYQEKQQIRLEPANSAYSAQIYDPKQICIQGQLAGILRSYH